MLSRNLKGGGHDKSEISGMGKACHYVKIIRVVMSIIYLFKIGTTFYPLRLTKKHDFDALIFYFF